MVLATHHVQGSYIPPRPVSRKEGIESRQYLATLHTVKRKDRFVSLQHKSFSRVGAPLVRASKGKSLAIKSFKGNVQNDVARDGASGSESLKKSIKVSYVSQENGETLTKSRKAQNAQVSFMSETETATAVKSLAIQKLFRSWLTLLRTPPNEEAHETSEESTSKNLLEKNIRVESSGRGEVLKAIWRNFLGLDATIKISLILFIPMYSAVNIKYGTEVSKELMPLWVIGPLIVALYIKMVRAMVSLYIFSLKQTVGVLKSLPSYYLVAFDYIGRGKLKEIVQTRFLQPLADIRSLDYKELSKRKLKDVEVWMVEKYLDFFESIWPYYCRTIRFLKRANLI